MPGEQAVLVKKLIKQYKNTDDQFYDAGYKYAGPILYSYMLWILLQVKRKNIDKLYFIARDGYPLYKIAMFLVEYYKLNVECKYLYCSRKSLVLASTIEKFDDELCNLTKYSIKCTLNVILDRIDANDEQKHRILQDLKNNGFKDIKLDTVLTLDNYDELSKYLISNKYYLDTLKRNALSSYELTTGYLKQEGLYDTDNVFIVDIGWAGSIQKYLNKIITNEKPDVRVNAFYFGSLNTAWLNNHKDLYSSWYFSANEHFLYCIPFSFNIMEKICTAPHGSTLKYIEEKGIYKPVLHKIDDKEKQITSSINSGMMAFVRHMTEQTDFNNFITMFYSYRGGGLPNIKIAS